MNETHQSSLSIDSIRSLKLHLHFSNRSRPSLETTLEQNISTLSWKATFNLPMAIAAAQHELKNPTRTSALPLNAEIKIKIKQMNSLSVNTNVTRSIYSLGGVSSYKQNYFMHTYI
jgi:hypothetical protein